MKRNLTIILFLFSVISFLIFTGCPSPLTPVDLDEPTATATETSDAENNGSISTGVSLTIPRYASWIGSRSVSRAYGFTDSVEVTVYDSGSSEVYNDIFEPTYDSNHQIECDIVLTPGSGYTVDIDIFNQSMSSTEPVVSGTSAAFDIAEGEVTQVPVICIPNNPTIAVTDTMYAFSGTSVAVDGNGSPVGSGTEFWYQITAPASGYIEVSVTDIPGDVMFYYATFNELGESVVSFGSDTGGPGPDVLPFPVTPGEIYYFGIVFAEEEAGAISGSISWTEAVPNYLTDEDVPDAELRRLLESYTGKEFTIVGEEAPASPIVDIELASFDSLRTDGGDGADVVTGITNLTGLSYCTGVDYLNLGNNDLSGADVHFEELAGLVNLTSFDIGGSNLQNLDFIDYLVNPDFHQFTFGDNPDVGLTEILRVTSSKFPNLYDLGFSDFDNDEDGVADPISGADWSQIVTQLAQFESLAELRFGDLSLTDSMLTELVNNVLNVRPANFVWLSFSYSLITDISGLINLTNLSSLDLCGSQISDLSPLQTLFDAGAFQNPIPWMIDDIVIDFCDLDLWPGTDNRAVVDYLVSNGGRISYEDGNNLDEPVAANDWGYDGGYTVSGTIDFNAITDRDDVDYISVFISDFPNTRDMSYDLNSSDISGYEVDYSLINLEPGVMYSLVAVAFDSADNNIAFGSTFIQSSASLEQDIIIRDFNDWGYPGGYSISGTIDFSGMKYPAEVDEIIVSIREADNNSNYINYPLVTEDFSGYTANYSFINLEPGLEYQLIVDILDDTDYPYWGDEILFSSTDSLTRDLTILEPNDAGYAGGGTLSGTVDFSGLSFTDDVTNIVFRLGGVTNGDELTYSIRYSDIVGTEVEYDFFNLDPEEEHYSLQVSAYDDLGNSTDTIQSNLHVPSSGMELDIELLDLNDWGYTGGGTISGSIDFGGISFASDVDYIQIGMSYTEDLETYRRYEYLFADDFSGNTASYSFVNADPDRTDYMLYVYIKSDSTGESTTITEVDIQVPTTGLIYDLTAVE